MQRTSDRLGTIRKKVRENVFSGFLAVPMTLPRCRGSRRFSWLCKSKICHDAHVGISGDEIRGFEVGENAYRKLAYLRFQILPTRL